MQNEDTMTAGQVRRHTGASRSQLRYWEAQGLIHPILAEHASRIWRLYPQDQVARIKELKRLLDGGFTLRGAARQSVSAVVADPAPVLAN